MPIFQQEFPLSWGYKNWLLTHKNCRLSLVCQEVGPLHSQCPHYFCFLFLINSLPSEMLGVWKFFSNLHSDCLNRNHISQTSGSFSSTQSTHSHIIKVHFKQIKGSFSSQMYNPQVWPLMKWDYNAFAPVRSKLCFHFWQQGEKWCQI